MSSGPSSGGDEARTLRAIDHAVVVGYRQWQHEPRLESLSFSARLHADLPTPRIALRRVDDGREMRAAEAARLEIEKSRLQVVGEIFPAACVR